MIWPTFSTPEALAAFYLMGFASGFFAGAIYGWWVGRK